MTSLVIGISHSETLRVEPRHTVPQVAPDWPGFSDMPPVFPTAMMVVFMEQTCIQAIRPHLKPGQHIVGTYVGISHVAATPVGMTVTAEVKLVEFDGRALTFRVSCRDDAGLIGEGTHMRASIDTERFTARIKDKAAKYIES
jgi:fluoroacetyl-CoA thioesterase